MPWQFLHSSFSKRNWICCEVYVPGGHGQNLTAGTQGCVFQLEEKAQRMAVHLRELPRPLGGPEL